MIDNYTCRAKCKDTGEWVYGYYVKHNTVTTCFVTDNPRPKHYIVNDGSACDWGFEPPLQATEVNPDTVCRCTGCTDKNDKLIFEGDIFVYSDEYSYVVKWDSKKIGFCAECVNEVYDYDYLNSFYGFLREVIGNIHDNPKLMEVSNE